MGLPFQIAGEYFLLFGFFAGLALLLHHHLGGRFTDAFASLALACVLLGLVAWVRPPSVAPDDVPVVNVFLGGLFKLLANIVLGLSLALFAFETYRWLRARRQAKSDPMGPPAPPARPLVAGLVLALRGARQKRHRTSEAAYPADPRQTS